MKGWRLCPNDRVFNSILTLLRQLDNRTYETILWLTVCLSPDPPAAAHGAMQRTGTRQEPAGLLRPGTGFDTNQTRLLLDSAGPGRICAHHYWSLRLEDFSATLVDETGSERSTAVPHADGQVTDPGARRRYWVYWETVGAMNTAIKQSMVGTCSSLVLYWYIFDEWHHIGQNKDPQPESQNFRNNWGHDEFKGAIDQRLKIGLKSLKNVGINLWNIIIKEKSKSSEISSTSTTCDIKCCEWILLQLC